MDEPKEPRAKTDEERLAELEAHANDPIGPPTKALLKALKLKKKLDRDRARNPVRSREGGT